MVNPISTRRGRFGHQILNCIYVNKTWFRIYSTFMHDDISPLIFDSFYQGGKMRGEALGEWKPTVWPEPIWIKVKKSWQIPTHHQSTYLGGPESASIEIPPFRHHFIKLSKTVFYEANLVSQCLHLEVLLLSKFGSERGDFNWCRFWASWVCTLMLW